MKNLMQYVDVCDGNEEDAELVLGYSRAIQMSRAEILSLQGTSRS